MEGFPEIYATLLKTSVGTDHLAISEVERLSREFEAHEREESRFLRQYKETATRTRNGLVRFLLQMIISDEEKHHAATRAMAATLQGDLNWTRPDTALRGLYDLVGEQDTLLRIAEDFIRVEKDGIKKYRELIRCSRGYYRDLFVVLFESMIHDSEKHIHVLEFLRTKLKEA